MNSEDIYWFAIFHGPIMVKYIFAPLYLNELLKAFFNSSEQTATWI